jgi:hypothetical protein
MDGVFIHSYSLVFLCITLESALTPRWNYHGSVSLLSENSLKRGINKKTET